MKAFLLLFLFCTPLFAQTLRLDEFKYPIPDIASRKLNKEELFTKMNRSLVRLGDSICSNRALMWVYDFKQKYNVESPKVFLFFTPKTGRHFATTWWYHVAPMVNENGKYWVVDAGFPKFVKGPMLLKDWLTKFTSENSTCKEILAGDDDLVERMFSGATFPQVTRHGKYDCYYKIVPPGYWTPEGVAKHILGRDADGVPVHYVRDEIDKDDVYLACLEAATSPFGWATGAGRGVCRDYIRTGLLKF